MDKMISIIKKTLLYLSLIVFILTVLIYLLHGLLPDIKIPERFTVHTVLETLTPAFTVLLIYELILLALSIEKSLIEFIRMQFEIVSLIILRELFKQLDGITNSATQVLSTITEPALVMGGVLVLYLLIEIMERLQRVYGRKRIEEHPELLAVKKFITRGVLAVIIILSIIEGTGWLAGISGYGFDVSYFTLIFSTLVICNILQLLFANLYMHKYETLFEYSALVLASVIVLIALPLQSILKLPLIIGAAIFAIMTLSLHGFARGSKFYK